MDRLESLFAELLGRPLSWASEGATVYVVGVMVRARIGDRPLCLELAHVGPDRILRLQEVGDEALFMSGFFPERLDHFGLPESYYDSIGSVAYSELSRRFPPGTGKILGELARHFGRFREGVREARRACDSDRLEHIILAGGWDRGPGG